jgi:hypothetical protein
MYDKMGKIQMIKDQLSVLQTNLDTLLFWVVAYYQGDRMSL